MKNNKDVFIFAIAYNCGKVLNKMLESFHKYHNARIHIFGTQDDFKDAMSHPNNVYVDLTNDENTKLGFEQGHVGTAYIWTKVINKEFGDYSKVIQIDSDVIFREECLSDVFSKFDEGYDLVGPRRAYKSMAEVPSNLSEKNKRARRCG
jgi:lipopolysaccharide biosynthesis glycosyltransferase